MALIGDANREAVYRPLQITGAFSTFVHQGSPYNAEDDLRRAEMAERKSRMLSEVQCVPTARIQSCFVVSMHPRPSGSAPRQLMHPFSAAGGFHCSDNPATRAFRRRLQHARIRQQSL